MSIVMSAMWSKGMMQYGTSNDGFGYVAMTTMALVTLVMSFFMTVVILFRRFVISVNMLAFVARLVASVNMLAFVARLVTAVCNRRLSSFTLVNTMLLFGLACQWAGDQY
jgi:uncharacterized membrane protein